MIRFFQIIGEWTLFITQTFGAIKLHARARQAIVAQLFSVLVGAIGLGIVAGISLGAVVYMHTYAVLQRSGTVEFLPTALAAAVLLELAPICAGLIVAARNGASLAAEFAAMKIGEQIDALTLFGQSIFQVLVTPRVLACMVALPLLHVLIATVAIFSGYMADCLVGTGSWRRYLDACTQELILAEVLAAGLKTVIFGLLIGVAGCWAGLQSSGGTEGIGRAATRGVVLACLGVLLADVFLVGIIRVFI